MPVWLLLVAACLIVLPNLASAQLPASGLVLWLKADAGVQTTGGGPAANGDPVTLWDDQSTQGNDATVPGGSTSATYLTGQINGLPALSFDSTTDRMALGTPLLANNTDFTIFGVIRGSGGGERVIGANFGTGVGGGKGLEFFMFGQKLRLFKGVEFPSPSPSVVLNSPLVADNTWVLVEAERNGSLFTVRLNFTNEASVTQAAAGTDAVTLSWTIGNGPNYTANIFGDMAEQIIYGRSLTADERQSVGFYLDQKYALGLGIESLAVPEPSVTVLLILSGLIVWRRRRV